MSDLRKAAQQALDFLEHGGNFVYPTKLADDLRAALAEPLTDEDISVLWHQSGEQPFKFARMLTR